MPGTGGGSTQLWALCPAVTLLQQWVCTHELSCSLVRGRDLTLKVGRMLIS